MILEHSDTWVSGALFSECRQYRYRLWRSWDTSKPVLGFVGLNPSTADETVDDNTMRKCQAFARAWGFGRFEMLNLFAWRSTDPHGLLCAAEPVGADNDRHLVDGARACDRLVLAWGSHTFLGELLTKRAGIVRTAISNGRDVGVLGVNKDGSPKHPLYLSVPKSPFQRLTVLQ